MDGEGDTATEVNLAAPSPVIQSVQILATTSTTGVPLYFDGVPDLVLLNPRLTAGVFAFDLNTVGGKFYVIQYKDDLSSPNSPDKTLTNGVISRWLRVITRGDQT